MISKISFCWVVLFHLLLARPLRAAANLTDLENAFSNNQWNETAEIANEILARDPKASLAKIKGAYGLFHRGFSNSALLFLKKLSPGEWKSIPQGQDRFVEIVSLFQKKVPLNLLPGRLEQVNLEEASPYLTDEIHFAKGREAFEKGDYANAQTHLNAVSRGSRYFSEARYVLGCIAIKSKDYKTATAEFSRILEPSVLEQSTEFWKDIGTQMTSYWGASLKVLFDSEYIAKAGFIGELALMGLARVAYATKNLNNALNHYERVPVRSALFPRSRLERIWTLLELNQYQNAQKAAAELSVNESLFESFEARTIRGIILVDSKQSLEARQEMLAFFKAYKAAKEGLLRFQQYQVTDSLPAFLTYDLQEDARLQSLKEYQANLKQEMDALRAEDHRIYPVYAYLAVQLEPLVSDSQKLINKMKMEHVRRRMADLDTLYVQARLILAETYLEDREKLREEFNLLTNATEDKQTEHDQKLVQLLTQAVDEVNEAMSKVPGRQLNIEFRQSEILWELSTARLILYQTSHNKKDEEIADTLRKKSIQIAEDFSLHFPNFEKHAQAMFFTGFAELEIGKMAEGTKTLEKYVALYPRHTHVPDAYRILGDLKFDSNKFKDAEDLYRSILQFEESLIVGYSLYKIGWCAYNQRDFAKALLALEKAINWANSAEKANQLFTLKREARRDLIAIYAEVGDHRKALEYFQRFFRDQASGWILDLAKQFDATGQFEKSIDLYHTLILMDPSGPENLSHQTSIVRGAFKLHRWPMVLETTKELVGRFRSNLTDPQTMETNPAVLAEQALREILLAHHFEFNKVDSPVDLDRQIELDELYLSAFEKWPSCQEPLYEYAHSLIRKKKQKEAVDAFRSHWVRFNSSVKDNLREEALRNLIHSLETVEASLKAVDTVSESAQEILKYSQIYESSYPKTKYVRAIAFLRSAILFKYNQVEKGIKESQSIFNANVNDEFGKRTFSDLRVAYYKRKNWEETYAWATEMASRTEPGMGTYAADLKAVREESLFLWAQNTEDPTKAADLFLKIAKDPEMRRLRDKSLYNAFIKYQKADKKLEALEIGNLLEKTAPTFEALPQIAGIRAAYFQDAGDYTRALPLLETFIERHDKDVAPEVVLQSRLNAALMAEGLEQPDHATKLYKEYLSLSPPTTTPGSTEARRGLARIESRTKRTTASAPFPLWAQLDKLKEDFEQRPVPKKGELPSRIQKGGAKLEQTAKAFLDVSSDAKTPNFFAFEAYCSVPFLYNSYGKALLAIGDEPEFKATPELKVELEKLSVPIDQKTRELADQCIRQAMDAEHDGPFFRDVLDKWGWATDKALKEKLSKLITALEKTAPFMDPATVKKSESVLIETHLKNGGTEDTWYTLGKLRYDAKNYSLARLTFVDSIVRKSPKKGRFLNGLAVLEQRNSEAKGLASLFENAAKEGSGAAWANLALYHLKGARIDPGYAALRKAYDADAFDEYSELKTAVKEALQK